MYLGAGAFLITVGIILIVVPRDATRTIPLDLIGTVFIALGAVGLLANTVRRLLFRRARA